MSNPNPSSPPRLTNGKERRNPSITPRKFKRFFTPRSRVPSRISPARRALQDLAVPEFNNRYQTPAPSSPLGPISEQQARDENIDPLDARVPKRRKFQHTPESSPCRPPLTADPNHREHSPSPRTRQGLLSPIRSLHSSQENLDSDEDESEDEIPTQSGPVRRLAPLTSRGFAGQLAQRQLGGMPRAGRSYMSFPISDWRIDTADFYSKPNDVHSCNSHEGPGRCTPFCAASCNRNSLVAIGDEEGRVRLLDSSNSSSEPFRKIHLCFQAHTNAVIDLNFSDDDYRLATASGDQTGRVIDMMTQTPIAILQNHTSSLKQIRFQPGKANGNVLATSSRDGSVQIWDLRCAGPLVQDAIVHPEDRETTLGFRRPPPKQGCSVNSLYRAHARTSRQIQQGALVGQGDTPSRRELPARAGDMSVTAIQFLPPGQEHLLLTACEADASIKLWDIRSIHSSRQKVPSSLSETAFPYSHHWRPFGITSLALNTDASRLYAVCKDNTVYAYSTAHLILGHAPELSTRNGEPPRKRHNAATHQGLGPIYGFRHPSLHVSSFYVKCSVRQARDGKSELLAVGSNDNCAVLFPTQERYFRDDLSCTMGPLTLENSTIAAAQEPSTSNRPISSAGVRRSLFRAGSTVNPPSRLDDDIPIVRKGTPLVRGHFSEVGSAVWTSEGNLVAVDDYCMIRCWREGREEAADLRTGGETGGRRWGCGWADVGEDWDVPDDDED
ncbi:WD40 repeat-like protein [Hypoxylon sp. NC0597]|nr:WD40 repeat-like protein [Hypoxylon sp. NC0597]